MKKVVYLLNIGDFAPDLCAITYPLIRYWARKIGADVQMITERRFPGWPVTYEKLQIHRLGQENGAEWHVYLDSDALIHPETPDWTAFIPRDTVTHNGSDMAAVRWRYDDVFNRDGRNIGSCNWNTIASSWCLDLWRPLEMTPEQALSNIFPTVDERNTVITAEHLVDDYALSRNIARFGLKFQTLVSLEKQLGFTDAGFYWHAYTVPVEDYPGLRVKHLGGEKKGEEEDIEVHVYNPDLHKQLGQATLPGKVTQMRKVLRQWRIDPARYA